MRSVGLPMQSAPSLNGTLIKLEPCRSRPGWFGRAWVTEPDEVRDRYDRLHHWRKTRAQARGVESDVILPRTTLRDLARRPPRTLEDLVDIAGFGPTPRAMYGQGILAITGNRTA